ncbi:MAG: SWF/SNF helicase family protein, partial [Candidatus Sericytochromatia bacterium]|nr:SWF/SNF helicase family protein [Candidatus Tanganyikabacteria bacterium]
LERLIDDRLRSAGSWRGDERLVVFTEYLATLNYVQERLKARYGEGEWLLALYGGMTDAERDGVKRAFNDPRSPAQVLVATDAAGEGLNLQRSARLLLHWDIPWNPSRMEQRNGRLDRHGQVRDVQVYHFDSEDDESIRFLGKVLRKRSQTREDRVVTDQIFADAIFSHFDDETDSKRSEERLERVIGNARFANNDAAADLATSVSLPGRADLTRLVELKGELDLSPATLRETLETAMAISASRPRLQPDGNGRDRLVHPVPALWQELVDHTLREGGPTGPLLALVFDPEHYVQSHDGTPQGRPVYLPEPDSRLLHLGDAIYHRVMSTFARYRFPGGPSAATRWTVRTGQVPEGYSAVVLLTVEELAANELREPCHHWVRTIALPVKADKVAPALPDQPMQNWGTPQSLGDRNASRDLWDEIEDDVVEQVRRLRQDLQTSLTARLQESGKVVRDREKKRFERRRKEIARAVGENQLNRLAKEADKLRAKAQQMSFFAEIDQALQRQLADLEAELALR